MEIFEQVDTRSVAKRVKSYLSRVFYKDETFSDMKYLSLDEISDLQEAPNVAYIETHLQNTREREENEAYKYT